MLLRHKHLSFAYWAHFRIRLEEELFISKKAEESRKSKVLKTLMSSKPSTRSVNLKRASYNSLEMYLSVCFNRKSKM